MEEEQDIQSDIVKQKQLRDAQENQEFDDAVAGGELEDLREGVKVRQKEKLLGSQLLDNIQGKFVEAGSAIMEAAQEDPDTWTDDLIRIGLGGVKNVGTILGAPGIKQGLQLVGAPAYYVGRGLGYGLEKAGVDPRYGYIAGEVGEWFIPGYGMYKAAGKIVKGTTGTIKKVQTISQADEFMKARKMQLAVDLQMNIKKGSGSTFKHSILNKTNRGLYKQLKNQDPKLIEQAENIIKELDLFKTTEGSSQQFTKWNPNRPTTGFRGTRTVPYINSSGVPSEVAFRWSVSKNTYVPYDLVRRQNTILKRLRWNVNRSPKAKWYSDKVYKIAKQDNAVLRKLLKELREENPQRYFDIMGDTRNYATNKGFIFVEHIHSQNSPYWKYVSKGQFKPRDTSNLMIVKNENFGKLKTSIEKHIYDNKDFVFPDGKRLILDYDKTRDVLVLKQLQDNGRLNRIGDISPITNPRNWKRALDAALEGHTIQTGKVGEIQQVIQGDPDIDRNVDLQHGISDWNKPKE